MPEPAAIGKGSVLAFFPARGLAPVPMKPAMTDVAHRSSELVADLVARRARLGKGRIMGFCG
jgi:hypothetical protein